MCSAAFRDFVGLQKFPVQEVLVKWSIQVWCASHLQPDLWHPAGALPSVPWELLGVSPLWSWWIGSTWWMTLLMRSACMVQVALQVPSWPAFLQWKMASSTAVALSCWASRLPVPWLAWLSLLWALPSLSEVMKLLLKLRIPEDQEAGGVDQHTHGESYHSPVKQYPKASHSASMSTSDTVWSHSTYQFSLIKPLWLNSCLFTRMNRVPICVFPHR